VVTNQSRSGKGCLADTAHLLVAVETAAYIHGLFNFNTIKEESHIWVTVGTTKLGHRYLIL
jgi:hypothetical protein